MPSARKRIIYTYDDWDFDDYSWFDDQLPEFGSNAMNGTHDHLVSRNGKKYFVAARPTTEDIDEVWNMVLSRITSTTTNYYAVLHQTEVEADPDVAWTNLVNDSGVFATSFSTGLPSGTTMAGKKLYQIVGGPNDGKYAAVRQDVWLNFWGMQTARTSLANHFYFGVGAGVAANYCISESVTMYQQSSGVYPLSTANAKLYAKSPGTPIQAFSSMSLTKNMMEIDTSIAASASPITVLISSTNRDAKPTLEDGYDGNAEAAIDLDFTSYARFVQYFGWSG